MSGHSNARPLSGPSAKQLVIRVPEDLKFALEADAAANGRTVAQSVRWHLARALDVQS